MALTDTQLVEYATMNPFIIYLDGGDHVKNKSVVAALLEGVRPGTSTTDSGRVTISPNSIKVRKQGVRKGELGYNAKGTITDRKLVPVFALVEERLVDEMRVSPAALAMGRACLRPDLRNVVDCLVEEYVEATPIEREFFLPEPVDTSTIGSPTLTARYVMPDGSDPDVESLFQSQLYGQLLTTTSQAIAAGVTPEEWEAKPMNGVTNMYDGNYVGSEAAAAPLVEAGVVADGELLDFNPEVHVIP